MSINRIIGVFLIGLLCATAWIVEATDTRVADAAMKNDKEAVRSLIKQAADINAAQGDGMTALHWAAMNGNLEIAQMLLYAGANVRAATRIGSYTPLFMAAKNGSSPILEALLKAGAGGNEKGTTGIDSPMMAATSGDVESVRILLEHGANPNAKENERGQTALGYAASFNRADAIKMLLKHGANVNLASTVIKPVAAIPKLFDIQNAQAAASAGTATPNAGAQRGQRGG